MLRIKEAIVVEGRYDKNTLSQLVDTVILETTGFGIFKNQEKLRLLRKIAQARGLIILTDSDGAGFVIRNYLKGSLPSELVKHAYIPDIHGKEHRKRHWGSEQKLGVEGMSQAVLEAALRRSGATFLEQTEVAQSAAVPITKTDLYLCGLTGGDGSAQLRQRLLKQLDLPEHLTPNGLLPVLNALYERDEFLTLADRLKEDSKP
jgi:ribonuclease M5